MKFQSSISSLRLVLLPPSVSNVNGIVINDSGVMISFQNGAFDLDAFLTRIELEKPTLVDSPIKKKAFIESVIKRLTTCHDFLAGKVWEYKVLTAEQRADLIKKQFDAQFDALQGEDKDRFIKQFTQNIPGVSVRHVDHDIVEVVSNVQSPAQRKPYKEEIRQEELIARLSEPEEVEERKPTGRPRSK